MRIRPLLFLTTVFLILLCLPPALQAKVVLADGGASAYLMGGSQPAVAMAVAMKADWIKLNAVMTRDDQVVVFHGPDLEEATDVAARFPDKRREDGSYHLTDLSLEEIEQLILRDPASRFPGNLDPHLTIATLAEQLAMIRGLEKTLQQPIRIALEIKQPWLYRKDNRDISRQVLAVLGEYNYGSQPGELTLLSFDSEELQRLAKELLPETGMNFALVQLIDNNSGSETMVREWGEWVSYNYDWMLSKSGLRALARSVTAIGMPMSLLVDQRGALLHPEFIDAAHQLNLKVYTYGGDRESLSPFPQAASFEEELDFLYNTVGVDGIVTGFCDQAPRFLKERQPSVAALPEPSGADNLQTNGFLLPQQPVPSDEPLEGE